MQNIQPVEDIRGAEAEIARLRHELELERRRSSSVAAELAHVKQLSAAAQNAYEQEEEFITNRLLGRLDELKADRAALAAQVEAEEDFLVNQLQRRLNQLHREKLQVETRLQDEQESAALLQRRLHELAEERVRLLREKAQLENTLEAEQEYLSLKLTKQVEKLAAEKTALAREKAELARQVADLSAAVDKARQEKVELENTLEAEEEAAVNRLQRQLQQVTTAYRALEARLEAHGVSPRAEGAPAVDPTTEWIYAHHGSNPFAMQVGANSLFGRTGSRSSDHMLGSRRERSLSVSSNSSMREASATHGHSRPIWETTQYPPVTGPLQGMTPLSATPVERHQSASSSPKFRRGASKARGNSALMDAPPM